MNASGCASLGCACRDRKPAYPSDLADAEWSVLEPEARAMMAEPVAATGRPMVHDLRAMLDAIGYVTRYGIEWRALPVDFPPHAAVYAFFVRWSRRGLPERLPGGSAASCAYWPDGVSFRRPGAWIPRRSGRPRPSERRPAVTTRARN
ncbi:transposase [Nonomuraea guangzhouensis]|uniref:Transposase n=1 Tax=Nonomuraea guangzhouensis TaxID=1291555 RepID=A0ABW4GU11_9ACTN|nr:transposase [Nonomuraea guangzhouensis]